MRCEKDGNIGKKERTGGMDDYRKNKSKKYERDTGERMNGDKSTKGRTRMRD